MVGMCCSTHLGEPRSSVRDLQFGLTPRGAREYELVVAVDYAIEVPLDLPLVTHWPTGR